MFGHKSLEQKLRNGGGVSAPATVVEIIHGKTRTQPSNVLAQVTVTVQVTPNRFRLTVTPEGDEPFEAVLEETDAFPPAGVQWGPRTVVVVLYDPADHSRVAVDQPATWAKWEELTRKRDREQAAAAQQPAGTGTEAPDVTMQLTRLADLHDRGALSDEEFAAEKVRLLAQG